jgi:hypothetical protein
VIEYGFMCVLLNWNVSMVSSADGVQGGQYLGLWLSKEGSSRNCVNIDRCGWDGNTR